MTRGPGSFDAWLDNLTESLQPKPAPVIAETAYKPPCTGECDTTGDISIHYESAGPGQEQCKHCGQIFP